MSINQKRKDSSGISTVIAHRNLSRRIFDYSEQNIILRYAKKHLFGIVVDFLERLRDVAQVDLLGGPGCRHPAPLKSVEK